MSISFPVGMRGARIAAVSAERDAVTPR
nr:TPA_asm: m69.1 ORF [Murid betaherpesvirus 1]DBA07808.1 TPA_asm: m69.1 ORF [Murid betaherpesvirus 1]